MKIWGIAKRLRQSVSLNYYNALFKTINEAISSSTAIRDLPKTTACSCNPVVLFSLIMLEKLNGEKLNFPIDSGMSVAALSSRWGLTKVVG